MQTETETITDEALLAKQAQVRQQHAARILELSTGLDPLPISSSPLARVKPGICTSCQRPVSPERYVCVECDEQIEQEAEARMKERRRRRFESIGIPSFYASGELSIHTYVPLTPSERAAKATVEQWATRRMTGKTNLFIHGKVGTGKTGLAASALARRMELVPENGYVSGLLAAWDDIVRDVQSAFKSEFMSEADVLSKYQQVDLLVIDDIGVASRSTDHAAKVLYAIVDWRYKFHLPMIVNSNRAFGELAAYIAPTEDRIQAERILSRLAEHTGELYLDGPDRRLK